MSKSSSRAYVMTPSKLFLHGILVALGTIVILWAANLLCTGKTGCCRASEKARPGSDAAGPPQSARDRKPRPPSPPKEESKPDSEKPSAPVPARKRLLVVGASTCPACANLKKSFAENNVQHTFIDVTQGKDATDSIPRNVMQAKSDDGQPVLSKGIPALFVLDEHDNVVDSSVGFSPAMLTADTGLLVRHNLL